MRKIKFAAAILSVTMLLCGCSDNSNSSGSSVGSGSSDSGSSSQEEMTIRDKTAALLEAVTFPEMVEVAEDNLSFYYKLSEDDIEEFSAYMCGSGAYPDEFGIFTAVSEDKASEIKTTLEERIEKQRKTYEDYSPDEMYKFDDCFVTVNGKNVCYAICADNYTAGETLY